MSEVDNQDDLWSEAKTLEDLGEVTARWIEGRVSFHPCYCADIDTETRPLQEKLAYFNRNGLVTTFSQPAEQLDEEGYSQRACVEGYAREEIAKKIAVLGLYTDLLVLIYPPDWQGGYQIPITLDEFHPFTWCGGVWGYRELECFAEDCSSEAMESLKSAWKVVVIDYGGGEKTTCGIAFMTH
jgi:uncharacterized protein DUF6919